MKAGAIFLKKPKASRTLTVTVRRTWPATGRRAIVPHTAEIVAAVADVLVAAAGAIVDVAGAGDVPAAAGAIADAADLAGEGTRTFATDFRGFTRIKLGHDSRRGLSYAYARNFLSGSQYLDFHPAFRLS